ncbi:BS_ykrK family protein [Streptococcus suis]|nr:BS_ykrK family protein [Streptococcus suis]CYW92309.1 BS_ykrK family protein [Streptococcus suis]CYZ71193.1 BS_ykrK family protein [Streptococcus suis]
MKQTIPYWHELPDLDLYLDQVLLYVNQVVNSQESLEQKSIDCCYD